MKSRMLLEVDSCLVIIINPDKSFMISREYNQTTPLSQSPLTEIKIYINQYYSACEEPNPYSTPSLQEAMSFRLLVCLFSEQCSPVHHLLFFCQVTRICSHIIKIKLRRLASLLVSTLSPSLSPQLSPPLSPQLSPPLWPPLPSSLPPPLLPPLPPLIITSPAISISPCQSLC